jgi:hypothetical protein
MSRCLTGLCARPVLFRKGPEIEEDDDDDLSESANQIKKMPTVVRISATPQLPLFQIMNNSRCTVCAVHVRFCEKSTEAVFAKNWLFPSSVHSGVQMITFACHCVALSGTENAMAVSEVGKSEKN